MTTIIYPNSGGTGLSSPTAGSLLVSNGSLSMSLAAISTGLTLSGGNLKVNLSTGVSGGQSVIGSTSTNSGLTVQATSGVGTTGADIIFKVGNNGATEAMRILNSGFVGIGTSGPTQLLHVLGNVLIGDGSDGSGLKIRGTDGSTLRTFDVTNTGRTNSLNIGAVGDGGDIRLHGTNTIIVTNGGTEYARFAQVLSFNSSASGLRIAASHGGTSYLEIGTDGGSGVDLFSTNGQHFSMGMSEIGEMFTLTTSGNGFVGIHLHDPTAVLDVYNSNSSNTSLKVSTLGGGDSIVLLEYLPTSASTNGQVWYTDAATAVSNNYNVLCYNPGGGSG